MSRPVSHDKLSVILFEASLNPSACDAYEAICRFAMDGFGRWQLHTVEYGIADEMLKSNALAKVPDIPELVRLWKPHGVIVECSGRRPQLPLEQFGKIPVVLLDCPSKLSVGKAVCVSPDDRSIVREAARELLSLGLSSYAYLPYPAQTAWSVQRGREFERLAKANGRTVVRLDAVQGVSDAGERVRSITCQLERLTKPTGIFAVNDEMARLVVSACGVAGLSVPDDVAVIGVDNDIRLCELDSVSISSVAVDFSELGRTAAQLLDEAMTYLRRHRGSVELTAVRLVRRSSTSRLKCADAHVRHALEVIRRHACQGLSPADVAREMGYSRRFADARFVATLGHTLQEEIHAVRLAKVKELLSKPGVVLSAIPDLCGYGSMSDLCRDFKKRTGKTLRMWQAQPE